MKIIKPYAEIIDDINGQDILQKIEKCGRVCYKSEGKICDGSAEKFVANIIARGHEAVLEHGSFIFKFPLSFYCDTIRVINELAEDECGFLSFLRFTNDKKPIVSGNVRAWRSFFKTLVEVKGVIPIEFEEFIRNNSILFPEFSDVEYNGKVYIRIEPLDVTDLETENEKLTHQDVTVKFVVDRGVSHEIVRHRIASYCQESTRYCNYIKEDFGADVTFIMPYYLEGSVAYAPWRDAMWQCENTYFKLLDIGLTPQEARTVLPHSLKTEVVMTANLREWRTFFKLRTPQAAHPQMREVTRPLLDRFKQLIPVVFDDIVYEE